MDNLDRLENLVAQIVLIALKDSPLGEKAAALSRAGFEPSEIAKLIGGPAGSVRQSLYEWRKSGSKARPKKKR